MSNFSFSHSVFKRLVSQGGQKVSLCGNGLKYLSQHVAVEANIDQDKVGQNMQTDL